MNSSILTSLHDPRTYSGLLTLDNLKIPLPIRALNPLGKRLRSEFQLPERFHAFGKKVRILPNGHVWIGKYVMNTNGTKILLKYVGVDYGKRCRPAKDQNYFDAEDIISIRTHFEEAGVTITEEFYLNQMTIFDEMLETVAKMLRTEGYEITWRPARGYRLPRIELSKDYLAPIEADELVGLIKNVVSACTGEPYNTGKMDTQFLSRERAFAYWSLKMPGPFLKSGRIQLKLYEKDSVLRLEVSAENILFDRVEDPVDPILETKRQLKCIIEELANYLRELDKKLVASDERINHLDLAELASVLRYYGLDLDKESTRILLYRLGGAAHAYSPANHRGKRIGRKTFANLCDADDGICDLRNPDYEWGARTITLRFDWRDRAVLRREKYEVSRSRRPK